MTMLCLEIDIILFMLGDLYMKLDEFKESDFILSNQGRYMSYSCDYSFEIWGKAWDLAISIDHDKSDSALVREKISRYLESCKKHIQWIDENKDRFVQALLNDGMADLAEDWASSETVERDGKIYYSLVDNMEIEAPITEEVFISCIGGGGANLYIDEDDSFSYDMFFSTEPDLFAYHSIEVFLDVDANYNYKIKVNGLAG